MPPKIAGGYGIRPYKKCKELLMDRTHILTFTVTELHADRFGRCRSASLLRFAQDAAGAHCMKLGADWDTMAAKGLFWAVIRQRLEITRLPNLGETVTVKTWPMPTTRVAYPRATVGLDAAGNELFKVISLWVIMDIQSRTMIRPVRSGVDVEGTVLGGELAAPAGLNFKDLPKETLRTVGFTELDVNGHMNNTRYIDWLCDLLPSDFHREHPMKAVTICYLNEALEGQQVHLHWDNGSVLQVEGSVSKTDANAGHTKIFTASMEF